ncbi:RNA polymerase sigma factor [Dyadobacter sandarakinus]|uniref:Sigma-70 family RNA polymerase sigma factor n=1 Tax=Dyadobacter sandarakinus TaxID=2747268 RepID=A0ABX7I8W6_9BACT|nr:sigma-70 family RNA polymerase sigma factor [Dyadobacter sandarakinus]QRR02369.1 sigma-70 family RNA polymerase sigma factor [Dyadobacter sandarakinus]
MFENFTDEELFAEIKQDNAGAFERLYHRYFYRILNDAYKRIHDHTQAEELVQELFVNLWLKRAQVNIEKKVDAYLHTSLRNAVISFYRKNNKLAELPADVSEQLYVHATDEEVTYNELKIAYDLRVSSLPEKCRNVYTLFENGFSIQEIADKTHVSPKTIESHLLKARTTLRQQLQEYCLSFSTLLYTLLAVL